MSELFEATSEDGTKVPYHIVLPKSWTKGELPVLIYGYGGFEVSLSPSYSGTTGLFVEQGGAYVQAYIRGGGELGPQWHEAARRGGRHKAFEDFVAVARDLVKRGYSKPSRIACTGGSNGGLLTSVMLTRYPDDFGAIWTRVPVTDMARFHKFPAGRAWMDEYGNPDVPEDLAFLTAYSPVHQVQTASAVTYPRPISTVPPMTTGCIPRMPAGLPSGFPIWGIRRSFTNSVRAVMAGREIRPSRRRVPPWATVSCG